jgi:hypothetical protein
MKCGNCEAVLSGEPACPTCGTLYTASPAGASIPSLVHELEGRLARALEGRYEMRGLLGHGGMGAVFLAAETSLDRLVAIKVLPPSLSMDEELLTRFRREAKTAARLDHPGIVPIYAVEDIDDLHFYVMKFVPGSELSEVIPEGGMDAERARQLVWESAVALGHAHRRGVIHRDVKPANIMLDPQGRAVLTDFGIAKAVRSGTAMTSTGQMIGTPQYMSPEQMEGKDVDGRADQYSLGMVAYHMLAGRQPFGPGSVASLLVKQLNEYPESLAVVRPDVPDAFVGAIERAIRKDPDERFETMEDFAAALKPGSMVGATPARGMSGSRARTTADGGPRRWIFAAAVVAALAVAGVLGRGMLTSADDSGAGIAGEVQSGIEAGATTRAQGDAGVSASTGGTEVGTAASGDEAPPAGTGEDAESAAEPPPEEPAPAPSETMPDEAGSGAGAVVSGGGGQASAPRTPVAPEEGYLTVNARPFATVDIDGIELPNFTPLNRHPLPPGSHVVVVRREGYVTVVDTVEITVGNVTTRSFVLIPNGGP